MIKDLGSQIESQLGKVSSSLLSRSDEKRVKPSIGDRQVLVEELSRYNSKITRHVTGKQHETEKSMRCTQEMLYNVGSQLEDIQKVLLSLSKDMQVLQARQISLEATFRENARHVYDRPDVSLNGTTLLHDMDEVHVNVKQRKKSAPPPTMMVTRSMKRGKSSSPTLSTSQDHNTDDDDDGSCRRLKRAARTIIPWEELRPDTLESEL